MSAGWAPTSDFLDRSRVTALTHAAREADFESLLARSTADPAWYWDLAVRHLGLPFSTPYEQVLDLSAGAPWARWFVGGTTNIASLCIDRWLDQPERLAVDWHGEDGERRRWSIGELHRQTEALAQALRASGVARGDSVAILLGMVPEAVAAFLAVGKIGAVVVPLFSGFGPEAVRVRIEDAGAVAIVTSDATLRRGAASPLAPVAAQAANDVPSVHTLVVLERTGGVQLPALRDGLQLLDWPSAAPGSPVTTTVPLPSDADLAIAYTSGTTGTPKGAVHVHGGMPIKVAAEGAFQHDLGPGDVLLWVSDMGWIMGPYQIIAALANGAALCLIEGLPDFPGPGRIWATVAESGVTTLGMSPTLVRNLMPAGDAAVTAHDLSTLRVLGSTGEPWNDTPWHWYFTVPGRGRCPVINMSGGTEVGGALLSGHPVQAIAPMSLVGPSLGVAADVVDGNGKRLRGATGELVATSPWPGMTKGLLGDPDRYLQTYWRRFEGTWAHGDFASVDTDGQWYIHGRSDDTMNVAGKRLGPVEPESAVVAHPAVIEAAAIGMPHEVTGEALHLFVVIHAGFEPDDALAEELRQVVGANLGAAFRPKTVVFVDQLPKTRSGKVMRRVVRAIALDEDLGDLASLDDEVALDAVRRAVSAVRP